MSEKNSTHVCDPKNPHDRHYTGEILHLTREEGITPQAFFKRLRRFLISILCTEVVIILLMYFYEGDAFLIKHFSYHVLFSIASILSAEKIRSTNEKSAIIFLLLPLLYIVVFGVFMKNMALFFIQ